LLLSCTFAGYKISQTELSLDSQVVALFSRHQVHKMSKFFFVAGVTYNIPVCVWLQEKHPYVPPLVFVRPTSTMAIKASQHVDTNGRVYHPFLHEWNYVC